MFFYIGRQPQENFPEHKTLGNFSVSTDPGWLQVKLGQYDIIYKGYVDSNPIEMLLDTIVQQTEPTLLGNFCAFVYDTIEKTLSIKTDLYRSFPIYFDNHGTATYATNLVAGPNTVYTNGLLAFDQNFVVSYTEFDVIGAIDTLANSTVQDIDQLLTKKIQQFAQHNQRPIRVFLSGGVDTLLLYSYIKRLNISHELIWSSHIDHDAFWLANSGDIQKYWAYSQVHYWKDPCALASGAPGDEFMLRSPTTANAYLMFHGSSIPELLAQNPNVLHREYFSRSKHIDLFDQQLQSDTSGKDIQTVYWKLCNILANDWQHWHIGNTLTWTPFRDLELFKLFLQLPLDLAQAQIMDSTVSRQLIEQNCPGLTSMISDQKNSGNPLKNLVGLYNELQ